jgi:hypothetical protein
VEIGVVEPDMERAVALMRALDPTSSGRQTWFVNYELMMIGPQSKPCSVWNLKFLLTPAGKISSVAE